MTNIIFRVLTVVLISISSLNTNAQCESHIKNFYITYMQNLEHNDEANIPLMQKYMSPELIAKLNNRAEQQGFDAVINAQDVCSHAINSIKITALEGGVLSRTNGAKTANL